MSKEIENKEPYAVKMEVTFYLKHGNEAGCITVLDEELNVTEKFNLEGYKNLETVYSGIIDLLRKRVEENNEQRE